MSTTTRTFVAIPIPDDRRGKLARLQSLIAPDVPGARWVEPSQFHVTLAFLGDVSHADLGSLCRRVAESTAGFEPFELRIEGLGVFPDEVRPRVAWVGLTGPGLEPLAALHAAVSSAVKEAGYPAEGRFSPHITLGRLKVARGSAVDLSPLLRHYKLWSPGSFTVEEVVSYSSNLTPEGPSYAALARAPLQVRKPEATP